jgi:hypothetical protein
VLPEYSNWACATCKPYCLALALALTCTCGCDWLFRLTLASHRRECSVWSTSTCSAEPCNAETIVELRCADFQTVWKTLRTCTPAPSVGSAICVNCLTIGDARQDKTWLEADVIFFTATCFCLELGTLAVPNCTQKLTVCTELHRDACHQGSTTSRGWAVNFAS